MITVLIGHRGVGKTSLLKRIQSYNAHALVFCLDQEIEKKYGSIQNIFELQGEETFRHLELEMFLSIYKEHVSRQQDVYIALGAGFKEPLPQDVWILWVRRGVDAAQFLFLDRPTLNSDKSKLQIPENIFLERESRYAQICDEQLILQEGIFSFSKGEQLFFNRDIKNIGGTLTLLPEHINKPKFKTWIKQRDNWGLNYFEIRDDLLSLEEIQVLLEYPFKTPLLYAARSGVPSLSLQEIIKKCSFVDWDMTLGQTPFIIRDRSQISCHTEKNHFDEDYQKIQKLSTPIKWAPIVESWEQLQRGHQWVMQAPSHRAFLPRSQDGRWNWYRQLMKNRMCINFWREDQGSSEDQPTLLDWLAVEDANENFAAVLGDPIKHSWSPVQHHTFFSEFNMNMVAIQVRTGESQSMMLDVLVSMGLKAAAVTSPLKLWASDLVNKEQTPINTIVWSCAEKKWLGTFTDPFGFQTLLNKRKLALSDLQTVVWGAGSMSKMIAQMYPQSSVLSARSGEIINACQVINPEVLVWASGDNGYDLLREQYPHWNPQWVIDLNYKENSPAIQYAFDKKATYVSGKEMFVGQAEEQQKFWRKVFSQ